MSSLTHGEVKVYSVPPNIDEKFSSIKERGQKIYYVSERTGRKARKENGGKWNAEVLATEIQTGDGIYNKVLFTKGIGLCDRIGRVAMGILVMVPGIPLSCGYMLCADDCYFCSEHCAVPICGQDGFYAYVQDSEATKELNESDYAAAGFESGKINSASIAAYIEEHSTNVVTIAGLGHQYLLFRRESGISSFIFVPYGEASQASVHTTWNSDGQPKNTSQLVQYIIKKAATYDGRGGRRQRITTNVTDPRKPLLNKETMLF